MNTSYKKLFMIDNTSVETGARFDWELGTVTFINKIADGFIVNTDTGEILEIPRTAVKFAVVDEL